MQLLITPKLSERRTAVIMLVLTVLYLLVEVGFNARLLDTVGGLASPDEIDSIEKYGRVISGVALTLFAWGHLIKKDLAAPKSHSLSLKLGMALVVCCTLMYFVQEAIITGLVAASSNDTRARAVLLVPLTNILPKEQVTLKGFDLGPQAYQSPEGKTFLATFSLQALAVPSLGDRFGKIADALFWRVAEDARGGAGKAHHNYLRVQEELEKRYRDSYLKGVSNYHRELNNTPVRQVNAWKEYTDTLYRNGMTPNSVPRGYVARVRSHVQQNIPVPNDWHPSDQEGFYAAVARKVRKEADAAFSMKSGGLPPGLDRNEFLRHQRIQEEWRGALKFGGSVQIPPGLSAAQYAETVHRAVLAEDVARLRKERQALPEAYADKGAYHKVGQDSIRALVVPPIALVFSLLGAFTHILKCGFWLLKIFRTPTGLFVWPVTGLYLAVVMLVPLTLTNSITQQPIFERLQTYSKEHLGEVAGGVSAGATRWAIQTQRYFYPVNETVRLRVLQGASFGYYEKHSI